MKAILHRYAAYNIWAHKKIFESLHQFKEEDIQQAMVSSFEGIVPTLLHLLDAENIWWQRMKLNEYVIVPSSHFEGSLADLEKLILQQAQAWEQWVAEAQEIQFEHEFRYYGLERQQLKISIADMLLHVFNHTSYHRGQIITMMRQLGLSKIPQTDYAFYLRNKK
ncbi:MAG: DinB family protein [Ferruginibacter sp.]